MSETEIPPLEPTVPAAEASPPSAQDPLTAVTQAKDAAEKQVAELKDRLLRSAAEFENYKKRVRKEVDDAAHQGRERLLKDLLTVVDNMTLALKHVADDNPAAKGVKMVEKQMLQALEKFGVVRFSALGSVFDPARHEAVAHQDTLDAAADTVVQEFAQGYLYQDRLFRAAMVAVARAPEGAEPAAPPAEEPKAE